MTNVDRLYISLLGPPNVGKSMLTDVLSAHLGAAVIRPRDAIQQTLAQQPYVEELFAPVDDLGWTSDYALAYAVRKAIDTLLLKVQKVILENLPWDGLQLLDLVHLISRTSSELVVLLIDAPDDVLLQRANRRRVCQTCERDPRGDPRRPAIQAVGDAERCGICGSQLAVRPDDTPEILTRRLNRSRGYLAEIMHYANSANIPIHHLDGTQSPEEVASMAFVILSQFSTLGLPLKGDTGDC
jgi:adenylate kinase